jgi:hypothetical protein
MTKKIIPMEEIVTCDICGKDDVPFRRDGLIIVKSSGLDFHGSPVGNATYSKDICDLCLPVLDKAIKDLIWKGKEDE